MENLQGEKHPQYSLCLTICQNQVMFFILDKDSSKYQEEEKDSKIRHYNRNMKVAIPKCVIS